MSYYPADSQGGCLQSLHRCCRQAYLYPVEARKVLYAAGAVVGVILVAVVWTSLSSDDTSPPQPLQPSTVLLESPLVVGSNYFPLHLRDLVHNNITKVKFNHNLENDLEFGNGTCINCQTDIPRLQSGLVASQVWSIGVPCESMYKDAVSLTLEQVDAMTRLISKYTQNLTFTESSSDLKTTFKNQQIGNILAVTSGQSIDGRMSVLRTMHRLGVRIMALTSSCSNVWASSCTDKNDTGLSDFGKRIVREMNRLGILIDLSESSHQTQLDTLSVTKAPVIFSRGAAYSLVPDNRNIKDDVLELMKTNKGIVMVTFAQKYISTSSNFSIGDVIDHINYIKNKTGTDGVAIGAEFDAEGQTYPSLLNDSSMYPNLFDEIGKTWTRPDLKKLAGENFIRVLRAVELLAEESASLPVDESYLLQFDSSCYSDYNERNSSASGSTSGSTTPPPAKPTTQVPPATVTKTPVTVTKTPVTVTKKPPTTNLPTTK